MNETLTIGALRQAVEKVAAWRCSAAHVVKTEQEAKEISASDPLGYVWQVGDEYYLIKRFPE